LFGTKLHELVNLLCNSMSQTRQFRSVQKWYQESHNHVLRSQGRKHVNREGNTGKQSISSNKRKTPFPQWYMTTGHPSSKRVIMICNLYCCLWQYWKRHQGFPRKSKNMQVSFRSYRPVTAPFHTYSSILWFLCHKALAKDHDVM